jgi:hypothetical protein
LRSQFSAMRALYRGPEGSGGDVLGCSSTGGHRRLRHRKRRRAQARLVAHRTETAPARANPNSRAPASLRDRPHRQRDQAGRPRALRSSKLRAWPPPQRHSAAARALRLAQAKELECDLDSERRTYFLSRIAIHVTDAPGMSRWAQEALRRRRPHRRQSRRLFRTARRAHDHDRRADSRVTEVGIASTA